MAITYLVLGTAPAQEEFVDLIDDSLGDLDDDLGIDLTYVDLQDRGEHLLVHVYEAPDNEVRVSVVKDDRTPVDYLAVEAPSRELLDNVSAFLRERLPVQDLEALQSSARRDISENPGVLVKLAIASDEPDEVTEDIIRDALKSDDLTVLSAAVEAASLAGWPAFAGVLAEYYVQHPEREIRELAGRALNALVMGNPSGS
ncbi:hypothetical protein [Streptomyces sp. NPDC018352]|uniref:hypothetical protein n=1 Tax=Streptomyces sp. NPDC018352 TaxID=3157194 RepID=UPI00340F5A64